LKSQFEDPTYDLDPNSIDEENPAEMNLTFFIYIIKDVLEYSGFLGDAGKNGLKMATREYRTAVAKFEFLSEKTTYLGKIQAFLEQ